MSMSRTAIAVGLLASAALTVPALADKPGDTDTTKTSKGVQERVCTGGTVSLDGPEVLWPPNHKMVNQVATATSDDDDTDSVPDTSISLTEAAIVESATGGDGGPNGPDSSTAAMSGPQSKVATTTYQVRAERSGKADGRTYVINWTATFEDKSSCSSSAATTSDAQMQPFTVFVPHDQGQGKANGRS